MTRILDWIAKHPLAAGFVVAGGVAAAYTAYKLLSAPGGKRTSPGSPGGWVARVMSEAERMLSLDTRTYVVQRGDTLGMIAGQLGTTVGELMDANPFIDDPERIEVDWKLDVPG